MSYNHDGAGGPTGFEHVFVCRPKVPVATGLPVPVGLPGAPESLRPGPKPPPGEAAAEGVGEAPGAAAAGLGLLSGGLPDGEAPGEVVETGEGLEGQRPQVAAQ